MLTKAADQKNLQKVNVAVARFRAYNCNIAYARALEDMLSGMVFNTELFVLLERTQMEKILAENNFDVDKCFSDECAAKMGKLIAVDKVILGSVSKLDDEYRIEIRVINVANSKVDLSLSREASDTGQFEGIVKEVIGNVKNYYLGYSLISGKYDLSFNYSMLFPLGDFSDGAGRGDGLMLNLYINKPFRWNKVFILSAGAYRFKTEEQYLKSIYQFPFTIALGQKFALTETLEMLPSLGLGYLFTRLEDDKFEYRGDGNYEYEVSYSHNPLLTLRNEFILKLYHRYFVTITPAYTLFFERKRIGQIAGLDLGVKMLF